MSDAGEAGPYREIGIGDLDSVADVLTAGFPRRNRAFWDACLVRLAEREIPQGQTRFGYVLDDGGVKGVVLAIPSRHDGGATTVVNISSWAVAESHRGAAAKGLYAHACAQAGVTYSNLSAAPHTVRTITRLGFEPWTAGQFCGIGTATGAVPADILSIDGAVTAGLDEDKAALLEHHRRHGCLAFCLRVGDRLAPLVFVKRRIKGLLPVAQLIYCNAFEDFTGNSRRISGHLAAAGRPLLLVDSNGPVHGMRGRYFAGKSPKYYRGPIPRSAVDHTYSEFVYVGF